MGDAHPAHPVPAPPTHPVGLASVESAPPVVELRGVAKRWGSTQALTSATFSVGKGITGLLGSNGAGKTTTLTLLLGLHEPDAGTVRVLGVDPVAAGPMVRARIGYAPEHDGLPPDVAAQDLVRHLAEVHGIPRRVATARASDALYEVGLGEERFRPVGTMSTGQRQRVKLAAAIVHDPALVLLDEPTNGLDPVQREQMLGLISHVGHDLGLDIILSSHLLDEVQRIADAVVIIDGGRAVVDGRLEDLRKGGEAELLVELDRAVADKVVSTLMRRGVRADLAGPAMLSLRPIDGDLDAAADALRDLLARRGVGLRSLRPRSRTLEDVFLDVDTGVRADGRAPGVASPAVERDDHATRIAS